MASREETVRALELRHGAENQKIFAASSVGVAGLGGLGSHIAAWLARLGVGRLVLADFDRVDLANIHRQQYYLADVGRPKCEALAEQLRRINPYLEYEAHDTRVTADNAPRIFAGCRVVCEAFDRPEEKAMLAEAVLGSMPETYLVAASGMAGCGAADDIRTERRMKRLRVCGDFGSGIECGLPVFAPRVALCAAHQATAAMRLLLGFDE